MDFRNQLVLIKGKDKTDAIAYLKLTVDKYLVRYSNSARPYTYRASDVRILKCRGTLDPQNVLIYENNQLLPNVTEIQDFGSWVRIFCGNKRPRSYQKRELFFEHNALTDKNARDCIAYFRQIADLISLRTEDDVKILVNQYKKLDFVGSNTVLAEYLCPRSGKNTPRPAQRMMIYPFGLNLSQWNAVNRAFSSQVSIIEGPPGTGKTQTILNIIANAILLNKSIAVVSNNNSATANVVEKLEKYGLSFITAYLGSTQNKQAFIDSQTGNYPAMRNWRLSHTQRRNLAVNVSALVTELTKMLRAQNRIAQVRQEILDLECEQRHYETYYQETSPVTPADKPSNRLRSASIINLWLECEALAEGRSQIGWWLKVKSVLLYGIHNFTFYSQPLDKIIHSLQKMYYIVKLRELIAEKERLEQKLARYHFQDMTRQLTSQSMSLLKAELANRFAAKKNRQIFSFDDLWKRPVAVINEYPLILSTTHSIRSSLSKDFMFDYVVIDEASQADVVTGALALSCAKNAVIVGDLMQLPNVIPERVKASAKNIWAQFDLPPAYNYTEHSLLSSSTAVWTHAPRTLLREHYRCHPKIIGFCNQKFYRGQLIVLTEDHGEPDVLGLYRTAPGNHARERINQRQIDVIREEVLPALKDVSPSDIGIISPYRDQATELNKQMTEEMQIDTVHKYQGRERDTIILTTVDNTIGQFVDNPNLLNVAVSRAVSRLRLIISADEQNENTNIGDLVKYINYNDPDGIIDSKIYSVFDLLYKGYSEKRQAFLRKHRRISQYDSENLMQAVIDSVLREPPFVKLSCVNHLPLRSLIRDPSLLSPAEKRYAMNEYTHTDFTIYNAMDKKPVLVIEVDGTRFHAAGTRQAERDAMKDAILAKYAIPLLRLRTDSSGEEEKLRTKLREILGISDKL